MPIAIPAKTPTSFSREGNDTDLYWRIIINRTCVGKTGGKRASCAMAASRRIQLTALSSNAHFPLPTIPPVSETNDQPVDLDLLATTTESEFTSPPAEKRLELTLFEPDEQRCPEFNYPDLICSKQTPEKKLQKADEVAEDRERNELEALARKFEGKYGGYCKKKKDRVQDLVDIGFGYDESDSFIDNSEAYDELVPASLTTKYGGFYINSGTLQFRPASEGGQKNETSDFDDNFKPKIQISSQKRKIKQGKDQKMGKKKKDDMLEQNEDEVVKKSDQQDEPPEQMKKKSKKPLSIDKMLKKFHKEKLQQLQMFNARERDQALNHSCAIMQAEGQDPPISADPLLTLIGSASADDLLQAVKAAELDFDLDGLLGEPQNICSPSQEENGEVLIEQVITKPPASLPEGLPPMLEQRIQELTQAVKKVEGQNKMEVLSSELSNVLLEVEVSSKKLSGKVRSRIFSYLASQLSCSKGTLVKRAKKLHNLQQDGRLKELLQKLENAVARSMPEQIIRFQSHCQAHSEARAAKLEADKKEQRVADGSDEEEEERSGKRVFGPRKRFRWNEEIRELICEIVNLKMTIYDLESPSCSSLEEYLKVFLEAEVKPLWPKGWMQSRILLIETRKAHGHITGVVARKKPMGTSKLKKASADPEDNKNILDIQGPPAIKRKRLSVPVSMQPEVGATLSTTAKTPSNTQTSTTFSIHPANHMEGVVRPSLGGSQLENHHPATQRSQMSVECVVQGTAVSTEKGLGQMMWNRTGMESDLKRLQSGEKATPKLTLVAPPDGPQGHCPSVVQGVARLLTTTSMGDAPVSMAAAAGEISCGNPALPTPSMSLLPSTYPTTAQPGILPSFAPLHALPFPGLSPGTKLPGQPLGCKGPAPGNFQHGLTHGNSMLCSSTLHLLSVPVSSPAPLHSITPWLFGLDGNQIHADGLNARRKLH
ncbi:ubinuclein-1 isoform X3 [Triplophysa dalaica]|uniref:ubinuclein-1 isoform X3 n=1 Tax=Triplophysa dalaica TaxID=1582913 RepID=UPI0024DFDEF7|nr:ubinuclein-1 isoform X3 [Triplophysa dalaica]